MVIVTRPWCCRCHGIVAGAFDAALLWHLIHGGDQTGRCNGGILIQLSLLLEIVTGMVESR